MVPSLAFFTPFQIKQTRSSFRCINHPYLAV
nr:MAG TPA: hypothetical protein [Caudoviricetes sp.]